MWQSARPIDTAPHDKAQERSLLLWCPEQGGWQTGVWFKGQWMDSITLKNPLPRLTGWKFRPTRRCRFFSRAEAKQQTTPDSTSAKHQRKKLACPLARGTRLVQRASMSSSVSATPWFIIQKVAADRQPVPLKPRRGGE